jgi:hypothetical protein
MATTTTTTNKPLNPRAQDLSPKGYNRAALFSGKALDFDGVNDLVTGSSAALPSSDYTIAAWFNVDTLKASGLVIWGDETASERRGMVLWDGGVGNWRLFSSTFASNIPSTTTIQAGRWYFGVVTLTAAGAATIYINGKQDGTGTNTLAAYTGTQYKIGDSGSSEFTDGKIAGVRVFNQVLTAAQVADLYLNPEKITPDGVATSALKLWLPMMEGAGASAYDGSGNGNDGTINGATWTAGVGSPVAQTALVSWNKGVNILKYSRAQFTAGSVENWNEGGGNPLTPLSVTGIDGQTNAAATYLNDQNSDADFAYYRAAPVVSGTQYKVTGWLKLGTATNAVVVLNNSVDWNTITGGNFVATAAAGYDQWKEFSITFTAPASTTINIHVGYHLETGVAAQTLGSFYMDAFSLRRVSDGDAYIKTNATAQTSAVLVPEGLTAGASIFGTDIITPRNAFALNLDGASWAQVGDNASLDFGSGEFSFEAWANFGLNDNQQTIFQKGDAGIGSARGINLFRTTANLVRVIITADSEVTIIGPSVTISTWNHVVITKDASNVKMYINGVYNSQVGSPAGTINVDTPLRIGTFNNAQYISGAIANPRIYNRALTAAEVLRNYNADKAKFGL